MKKIIFAVASLLCCVYAYSQSVDGLAYGSFHSKEAIRAALPSAVEINGTDGSQVFKVGNSTFGFDFTGAYESTDGRFVSVDICDEDHVVKFPLGEFKVGDNLEKLLYRRGDMEFVNTPDKICRLSYYNKGGNKVSVMIKYDDDKVIREIRDLSIGEKKKKDASATKYGFYNAVPVVETSGITLNAGDPLSRLLDINVDIEFSSYGNGVCKISSSKLRVQYLIRYDTNYTIKEILLL